jgi:hypothetical protein
MQELGDCCIFDGLETECNDETHYAQNPNLYLEGEDIVQTMLDIAPSPPPSSVGISELILNRISDSARKLSLDTDAILHHVRLIDFAPLADLSSKILVCGCLYVAALRGLRKKVPTNAIAVACDVTPPTARKAIAIFTK